MAQPSDYIGNSTCAFSTSLMNSAIPSLTTWLNTLANGLFKPTQYIANVTRMGCTTVPSLMPDFAVSCGFMGLQHAKRLYSYGTWGPLQRVCPSLACTSSTPRTQPCASLWLAPIQGAC